jgi:hypothetical protein
MKKLFIIALTCVACGASAAPKADKPKSPPAAAAKPAAPAPEAPKERKPGFWERAWQSTKTGTQRAWDATKRAGSKTVDTVTSPFSGKKKESESKTGWRQLSMGVTIDPPQVKLPGTNSLRVKVTVNNRGKHAVQLDFPTTQRVEVLVKNDSGKVLSRWSDDQRVDKEQGFVVLNPDERLEYSATVSTREMRAGQSYEIEAYFPDYDKLRASRPVSPVQ